MHSSFIFFSECTQTPQWTHEVLLQSMNYHLKFSSVKFLGVVTAQGAWVWLPPTVNKNSFLCSGG